jgi:hypothetical protein
MDQEVREKDLNARLDRFLDHCNSNLSELERSKIGLSDFYKFVGQEMIGS